jgi:hypothetical protein
MVKSFAYTIDEQQVVIQLIGVFCGANVIFNGFFS